MESSSRKHSNSLPSTAASGAAWPHCPCVLLGDPRQKPWLLHPAICGGKGWMEVSELRGEGAGSTLPKLCSCSGVSPDKSLQLPFLPFLQLLSIEAEMSQRNVVYCLVIIMGCSWSQLLMLSTRMYLLLLQKLSFCDSPTSWTCKKTKLLSDWIPQAVIASIEGNTIWFSKPYSPQSYFHIN